MIAMITSDVNLQERTKNNKRAKDGHKETGTHNSGYDEVMGCKVRVKWFVCIMADD